MQITKAIEPNTIESSELVKATFEFWLNDHDHIRSPFPIYIHNDLKRLGTERFFNWASTLTDEAKHEMNEEMIGEKFEEIIFDAATQLVKTEDEKLTILYPFLPRTGDKLIDENKLDGSVVDRSLQRKGDKSYLKVKAQRTDGSSWVTEFELPV